jgi:hypothetical protein
LSHGHGKEIEFALAALAALRVNECHHANISRRLRRLLVFTLFFLLYGFLLYDFITPLPDCALNEFDGRKVFIPSLMRLEAESLKLLPLATSDAI